MIRIKLKDSMFSMIENYSIEISDSFTFFLAFKTECHSIKKVEYFLRSEQ